MVEPRMTTHADRIEAALRSHEVATNEGDYIYCLGCEFKGWVEQHRAHVATVLAALTPEPVAGGLTDGEQARQEVRNFVYLRFPGWDEYRYDELVDRIDGIYAAARAVPVPAETCCPDPGNGVEFHRGDCPNRPAETDGLAGVRGQWFGLMDHILSAHRLAHANEYDYCGGCGKEYEYASEERHNEHIRDEMLAAMRDEPALLDVAAPAPEGETCRHGVPVGSYCTALRCAWDASQGRPTAAPAPGGERHNHDAIGVYGNCPACGTVIPAPEGER